jgi:UDP-glucose 4-epimerase
MMRVVVTGATGFLGSHLARRLVSDLLGIRVIGLTHCRPAAPIDGVTYADELPTDELAESDVLFHLAGSGGIAASLSDPVGDLERNAVLTVRFLEAIRTARARCSIVLASSCAVYGPVEGTVMETQPLAPQNPYGASKLAAETYVSVYHQFYGIDGRVARIANPYGVGQRRLAIYELVDRALRDGPPLPVRGRGLEVRDFIHADDVARALIAIALEGEAGGIYNVGSGHAVTMREVASLVTDATDIAAEDVVFDGIDEPGKVVEFSPHIGRLRALGFEPRRSLADGIREIVDWVRCGA